MFPDFSFPFSICSRLSQQRTLMARIQHFCNSCSRESPASCNHAAASGTSSVLAVINPVISNEVERQISRMLFEDRWVRLGKWERGTLQLRPSGKGSPCWDSFSKDVFFLLF